MTLNLGKVCGDAKNWRKPLVMLKIGESLW